jgi:hypothetical protein
LHLAAMVLAFEAASTASACSSNRN